MSTGRTLVDGHGHPVRGRSASADAATRAAMCRLLSLGGVDADEVWTDLSHGRLLHLASGSGEPLVFLQGAGGGAANWYRLFGPLGRTRRALAPELPGFGLSDATAPRGALGVDGADVMETWLDRTVGKAPVDVVATSFGGLVALHLAARGRVRRLALLNATGLGRAVAPHARLAGLPACRRLVAAPSRAGTRLVFRLLLTSDRSKMPRSHQDALVEYAWHSALGGAAQTLSMALPRFAGLAGQREVLGAPELARVACPVLMAWGTADRFLPARQGARAVQMLPSATWLPLPGVGHSPNWEAPAAVIPALRGFFRIS